MDKRKYVDESWKESAEEAKQKLKKVEAPVHVTSREEQKELGGSGDFNENGGGENEQNENHEEQSPAEHGHNADHGQIEINFMNYVTSLGYQAMIFLGEIPNPMTNELEKNLDQAKFLIDTLIMIKEKTKGNLNPQEDNMINATTYELEMKFVELKQKGVLS